MRKIMIGILMTAFMLSACQSDSIQSTPPTQVNTSEISEPSKDTDGSPEEATQDTSEDTEPGSNKGDTEALSPHMSEFMSMILPTTNAGDLGNFIEGHIDQANTQEAETMIKWLLIYQTETMEHFNNSFYTEPYYEALNLTMGGIIDPDKIPDISDDEIRNNFQIAHEGYTTIIRYEETPVLETDWDRLKSFAPYVSDNFALMIDLKAKAQNTNPEEDMEAYAQAIIELEEKILTTEDNYLKKQYQSIHRQMVSNLLVGPEGSYLGTFVAKNDQVFDTLSNFGQNNPTTGFGGLLVTLTSQDWDDFTGPNRLYQNFVQFGYGSDFYLYEVYTGDTHWQPDLLRVGSDSQGTIASAVNITVDQTIAGFTEESGADSYGTGMYVGLSNDDYLSLLLSYRYTQDDRTVFLEKPMTFDMTTGKEITFYDFIGMTEADALVTIKELSGTDFDLFPYMEIMNGRMLLRDASKARPSKEPAILTPKDLIPYVKLEDLIW